MEAITTDSSVNLLQHLAQFTGTETYYNHSLGNMKLYLTDGCHFIREQCEAYWLFDLILSHQLSKNVKSEQFQVWKFQKRVNDWIITCSNGNDKLLVKQIIEYSDFPLNEITIWLEENIALLPSEH